jgi:hypothetical protein
LGSNCCEIHLSDENTSDCTLLKEAGSQQTGQRIYEGAVHWIAVSARPFAYEKLSN